MRRHRPVHEPGPPVGPPRRQRRLRRRAARGRVDGQELFFSHVGLRGGPAPVRRYLPDLIDRVLAGAIDPGKVFDLTLPLDQVAEGYKAMDERRAIKTLLTP
ncbi:threonine dehydrogenase-like Zn-dependent dehydrogenase [Streptomyces sp. B1I3]|nr:threonine dehydrogenase-like Zn-dependent dehydrogenase [Streptomyces sp. B1I3]